MAVSLIWSSLVGGILVKSSLSTTYIFISRQGTKVPIKVNVALSLETFYQKAEKMPNAHGVETSVLRGE